MGGCFSGVGWRDGVVQMDLSSDCTEIGAIMHEFGHALGMSHEHERADRGKYITIHWDNIQPKWKYAFNRQHMTDIKVKTEDQCECTHFKKQGLCTKGNQWYDWMEQNCAKT